MICPGCLGCGWRPYFVETVEGEEERAWELCRECGDGDAFPSKGGRAGSNLEQPEVFVGDHVSPRHDLHAYSNGREGPASERHGAEGMCYTALKHLSR